jgi:hypothetical protein
MHSQEIGVDQGGKIYSATAEGVLVSTNDGATWDDITGGIPGQSTWSLVITSNDNVYVGTFIDGVCRRLSSAITSVGETHNELPAETMLYNNYPNPFNPATVVRYQLPLASEVKLVVFDLLGREVSVLVDEKREAGIHEVKFDASHLPSGVYFYRLQAGNFVETKKLVLVR